MGRHVVDDRRVSPETEALVELGQVLLALSNELGSQAQFFKAATSSGVLMSESVQLDAEGHWSRDFSIPFAAVSTTNLSGSQLVISGDGLQDNAPELGPGVFHVPAGGFACHNLLSGVLSLYGAASAVIDVVVYLRPQPASFGVTNALSSPPVTFADGVQTVVGAAAVPIVSANANRGGVMVTNVGANPVRIGLAGVTATTGFTHLAAGQEATLPTGQALYAIRTGGADSTVLVAEVT